jgi:hypothetical protein
MGFPDPHLKDVKQFTTTDTLLGITHAGACAVT